MPLLVGFDLLPEHLVAGFLLLNFLLLLLKDCCRFCRGSSGPVAFMPLVNHGTANQSGQIVIPGVALVGGTRVIGCALLLNEGRGV
jgi:hypothetical protein